jgi:hypothetical protein
MTARAAASRASRALLLAALLAPATGCQGYAFEELPTSVIREKRWSTKVNVSSAVDILFVVDNSRSMVGEQTAIAASFSAFTDKLEESFGDDYHIAVVTTGMYSPGCQDCPDNKEVFSCITETGETGRFQDRLGHNQGTIQDPDFVFSTDRDCRVMDGSNLERCFYDADAEQGVILVGTRGCGYEKGLAPVRAALSADLLGSWNSGFLRQDAILVVVVVTDEEDCGEVGDINEDIVGFYGNYCYYAAKGVAPDGALVDELGKPFELTPVRDYYDFLMDLKDGREGLVKFAAIVGVEDADEPQATQIEYASQAANSQASYACQVPDCVQHCDPASADYDACITACHAYPGTRYIALAEMFGLEEGEDKFGFVDTICQADFSETLEKLGDFVGCPRVFNLTEKILDPGLANILVDGEPVPRYSCDGSSPERIEICDPTANDCAAGECVETWVYEPPSDPPAENAPGGRIRFAGHYDPCSLISEGEIEIELVYATL